MTYPMKPLPSFAPSYVALYPTLAAVARQCGYSLAVHGSLARDFDLIAVPWVKEAAPAETLIEALCAMVGGSLERRLIGDYTEKQPSEKPHGRRAWSIYMGGAYLDVSVMPTVVEPPELPTVEPQ